MKDFDGHDTSSLGGIQSDQDQDPDPGVVILSDNLPPTEAEYGECIVA